MIQNDKQRRMEYVQQIQKLRKEQRYYSMWELPPLLEVETDSAGESGGSEGSLSPAATSGVCSSSESAWSDVSVNVQYCFKLFIALLYKRRKVIKS